MYTKALKMLTQDPGDGKYTIPFFKNVSSYTSWWGSTGPNSSPHLCGQGNGQQSSLALVSSLRDFTVWVFFCCSVGAREAREISSWLWIYMEIHQPLALTQSMKGDESIRGGFWNIWSSSWHFETQDICKRMRDVNPEAKMMNVDSNLVVT